MPLSEEDFKRLPDDVQQATLDQARAQRIAAILYAQRVKKRAVNGAAIAGIGAMLLSVIVANELVFYLLIGAAAAAAGWLTVYLRYKIIGGIALVGGACVLVCVIGSCLGWCLPIFFVWIFYIVLGLIVGAWADGRRSAEDIGY